VLYTQNGDDIVTIDSVTSLHPMYNRIARLQLTTAVWPASQPSLQAPLVENIMHTIGLVHPSAHPSVYMDQLTFDVFASVLVMTTARSVLKVKVKVTGHRSVQKCLLDEYLRRPMVAVVVGFHCDVVSCELARRGVRCCEAEAGQQQRRSTTRVGVATRSV